MNAKTARLIRRAAGGSIRLEDALKAKWKGKTPAERKRFRTALELAARGATRVKVPAAAGVAAPPVPDDERILNEIVGELDAAWKRKQQAARRRRRGGLALGATAPDRSSP